MKEGNTKIPNMKVLRSSYSLFQSMDEFKNVSNIPHFNYFNLNKSKTMGRNKKET